MGEAELVFLTVESQDALIEVGQRRICIPVGQMLRMGGKQLTNALPDDIPR